MNLVAGVEGVMVKMIWPSPRRRTGQQMHITFNTFWVSASSSSKRATSSLRRSTSCSSWLRLFACARWEATRLCFRLAFSSALRGGKQTEPTVTGLSKLLCEECKAPSEGEERRKKERRRRSLRQKNKPEKEPRHEKKLKIDYFR